MNYNNLCPKWFFYFFATTLSVFFYGCSEQSTEPDADPKRGDIISITSLNTYSTEEIKQVLTAAEMSGNFDLTYSVEAVRIEYWTIDVQGNYIQVSGAVMIPLNAENIPLFNLNHGTKLKRDMVASVNPINITEGIVGLIMGSKGYYSCIPDYPGFGVSNILHPYTHSKSITNAVIDFIRAAKTFSNENNITLNDQLFITGYSEGGYVALATQKEIEENHTDEFQITAVAPMAGPYDLNSTATELFQQTSYDWPANIAFLLTAYNDIYGWDRLDSIFKDPYGNMMSGLFDGTQTLWEVNTQLPKTITDLLNQSFINNYLNGSDSTTISALRENTLLDWNPIAPIRFYHGDADEVASYQNSLTVVENLKAGGSENINLVTIEGGTHESAGIPCVLDMIEWFSSF